MKSRHPFPRRLLAWFSCCAVLAAIHLPTVAAAENIGSAGNAGLVLVAQVTGTATMVVDARTTPLTRDSHVPSRATIKTQSNSSAVLMLSNGAQLRIAAASEIFLDEFLQDPFVNPVKVSDMVTEPSPSRTKLRFLRGDITVRVPKLNFPGGSSFVVETPGGLLGIRGTIFRVTYDPTATAADKNAVVVSVLEGAVSVEPHGGEPTLLTEGRTLTLTPAVPAK